MSNRRHFALSMAAAALAGCSALPQRPVRPIQYDLGPSPAPLQAPLHPGLPPLVLGDLESSNAFVTSSLLFRLGYADPNQLRPYARASRSRRRCRISCGTGALHRAIGWRASASC